MSHQASTSDDVISGKENIRTVWDAAHREVFKLIALPIAVFGLCAATINTTSDAVSTAYYITSTYLTWKTVDSYYSLKDKLSKIHLPQQQPQP